MSNLKVYCQSCGHAHAYTLQKPNFCQSCGASLGSVSHPASNAKQEPREVEENRVSFENLNGLEFGLETFDSPAPTLGSIMEQHSSSPPPKNALEREKNPLSPEETLAQLKKESSAIRPRSSQ